MNAQGQRVDVAKDDDAWVAVVSDGVYTRCDSDPIGEGRYVSHVRARTELPEGAKLYLHRFTADDDVQELVDAIKAFRSVRGSFMALGKQDKRTVRLWEALARVGGAQS